MSSSSSSSSWCARPPGRGAVPPDSLKWSIVIIILTFHCSLTRKTAWKRVSISFSHILQLPRPLFHPKLVFLRSPYRFLEWKIQISFKYHISMQGKDSDPLSRNLEKKASLSPPYLQIYKSFDRFTNPLLGWGQWGLFLQISTEGVWVVSLHGNMIF